MPRPLGRKGFFVSTPLVGAVLFLTAAVLTVLMTTENDARIFTARSTDSQGTLQFMAEAMMADSYDVLLQQKLEKLTTDYLKDDYFDINTQEANWKQNMKSNLEDYYTSRLGSTLGMDIEAYAQAYAEMPGISECNVDRVGNYTSNPSADDSDMNDGTLRVRGYSFGERIHCRASDPEGEVTVDITGRYYRVNVRVPNLYEVARWIISTSKAAINLEASGINEPIAKWDSPKWAIVNKVDNRLVKPGEVQLENLANNWATLMDGWFQGRIKDVSNAHAREVGYTGVTLQEFKVAQENERNYNLSDFEIACAEGEPGIDQDSYRNCMPFRVAMTLGDKECTDKEPPKTPDNSNPNPLYNLQIGSLSLKCGSGACPRAMTSIMEEIVKPLGSVCVEYNAYVDSVYPVCKKWNAKPKSILLKGTLNDDNPDYVVANLNETIFKFKDQQPNVDTTRIRAKRLTCIGESPDRSPEGNEMDSDLYKQNVRKLLQNMDIRLGSGKDSNSARVLWVDKGSSLSQLNDENLKDVYRTIYEQGTLPIPCMTGGIRPDPKCDASENREKPRMQIEVDWGEVRSNCINRVNGLCEALCGGNALPEGTETFCKGLFPNTDANTGGKGELRCGGAPACGNTYIEITNMEFGIAGISGF